MISQGATWSVDPQAMDHARIGIFVKNYPFGLNRMKTPTPSDEGINTVLLVNASCFEFDLITKYVSLFIVNVTVVCKHIKKHKFLQYVEWTPTYVLGIRTSVLSLVAAQFNHIVWPRNTH